MRNLKSFWKCFLDESLFVFKVESAGRDFENKIEMSQEIKLPKAFQISNPLVDFILGKQKIFISLQSTQQCILLGEKRKLEGNQKKSVFVKIVKITSQLISISKFVLMHLR